MTAVCLATTHFTWAGDEQVAGRRSEAHGLDPPANAQAPAGTVRPLLTIGRQQRMASSERNNKLDQVRWLGVLSDTHGNVLATRRAVRVFESLQVDVIIHCGDIGSPDIPALLAAWPAHYVLGNVDGDTASLREAISAAGHDCHGRFADLQLQPWRVAVLHGDDLDRLRTTIRSGAWDVVCYGHTHLAENRFEARTLVLNPGAVHRARIPSVAVVDLAGREVTAVPLE